MKADDFRSLIAHIKDASRILNRGVEYGPKDPVAPSTIEGLIDGVRDINHSREQALIVLDQITLTFEERVAAARKILIIEDEPLKDLPAAPPLTIARPGQPATHRTAGGSAG